MRPYTRVKLLHEPEPPLIVRQWMYGFILVLQFVSWSLASYDKGSLPDGETKISS